MKPSPLNDYSVDARGGKLKVQVATVLPLGPQSMLQEQIGAGRGIADKGRGRGRGKRKEGRWWGA